MERKELNETLFTKAFETQRLASMVARQVVSHFNYKICELRRRPGKLSERLPMGRRSGSRCIEFIIRPNFLTSNSR
ncbi:hypothetical protein MAL08_12585 [Leptospira noguchii]|uniref:hypothetical protein n=1 Tax=Leptospira noguchii TaxID=28182 RepID=UPI001FB7EAAB|nr:hypothetical protein [Leptospira noguchii]UOG36930.1 hypothetical protein MAL08_12585 [Leptospira noguchii]